MTEIAQRYQSRPTMRWASLPLTEDNRADVMEWILRWGGRCRLTPEGYEVGLVLDNPMHGELDVRYGDRVMYNEVLGGDFYPTAPESFEAGWAPLTGDDDASA